MPAGKAPKGAPQASPASGGDRIGALPDEILHRVLSFLPAKQAVQTCVLGRRWLHLWKSAAVLRIVGADANAPLPFEEYIFRRDLKCCPTFSRLKSLLLNEHWCDPDIHVLARILEHSPVLEELYLCLFYKMRELNVLMKGRFSPKELPPTISPHLKRVEVRCGTVHKRVLQVLKFLGKLNISFIFSE